MYKILYVIWWDGCTFNFNQIKYILESTNKGKYNQNIITICFRFYLNAKIGWQNEMKSEITTISYWTKP